MVIARSLFRRLVAREQDWRQCFANPDQFATKDEALAVIDAMPASVEWMPPCDDVDDTGRCQGHPSEDA
jgi:hypothetical protein